MAYSGSGNSSNVVRGLEVAVAAGARTFAMTKGDGGRCARLAGTCLTVPGTSRYPGQTGCNDNNFHFEDAMLAVNHMLVGLFKAPRRGASAMLTVQPTGPTYAYLTRFLDLIGPDRAQNLREAAGAIRARLDGGTLWHVSSTAAGGGVAEMLHTLIPLYRPLACRRVGWSSTVMSLSSPLQSIWRRTVRGRWRRPAAGRQRAGHIRVGAGDNAEAARRVVRGSDVLLLT